MSKAVQVVSTVVKPTFVSIVMKEKDKLVPYRLNSTHPTFSKLKYALSRKQYARVPSLLTLATEVSNQSQGHIVVKKDGVFYKGRRVESALTRKIADLLSARKPIAIWLRFMDNLFQNPSEEAQNELYEWLVSFNNGKFVPTDDGCFVAYKYVNPDFTDCHTGTIINKPGACPKMKRTDVDPNRNNECSRGYHFCSLGYLGVFAGWHKSGSGHIMAVKVNPADVVSIPRDYNFTKGRTWQYEVLFELEEFDANSSVDHPLMQQLFIETPDGPTEKAYYLKALYALPNVKRLLTQRKLTRTSLRKASTSRLRKWYNQFNAMLNPPTISKLFENPLKPAREAAGLSIGEVAAECDVPYKVIWNAEQAVTPDPQVVQLVIGAIASLRGTKGGSCNHVNYPEAAKSSRGQATQPVTTEVETDADGDAGYDGLYSDPYGYDVEEDDEEEQD